MIRIIKNIKHEKQIKKIRTAKYNEAFLEYLNTLLRQNCHNEIFLTILQRVSFEWKNSTILADREASEHNLFQNMIVIIEAKMAKSFKQQLIRNGTIISEFKFPFTSTLEEEKIVIKDLYLRYLSTPSDIVRKSYFRDIFKSNLYFSVLIVQKWQELINGLKDDTYWIRIYLTFSLNHSLINKILVYLIENYPVKFLPEIKQILTREVHEFAQPANFSKLGYLLIDKLLEQHKYSTKFVYELIAEDKLLKRYFLHCFEHYLTLDNYDMIFNIKKSPIVEYEKIYLLFKSLSDEVVTVGKYIRDSDQDRQLLQLIKKACFVENNSDYAIFSIDSFKCCLFNIGDGLNSKQALKGYNWLFIAQGSKDSLQSDYLIDNFSLKFMDRVKSVLEGEK